MFSILTRLRHGALKRFRFVWTPLRAIYRLLMIVTPGWSVSKMIGPYGPFKMDRRFAFSNFARWGSAHNRGFVACIEEARGMKTVFDIGAHIGLVALPLSKSVDPAGKVFAFEPAKTNRAFLEDHIRSNGIGNIEIVSDLVGSEAVEAISFFESSSDSGMNTIAEARRRSGFTETTVKQITLDEFCNESALRPELIKIDTEGAELSILQGASAVLREYHPIIFLSVHPRHIADLGGSVEELEELLTEHGYQVNDMDGNIVRPTELTEYVIRPA